MPAVLRRWPLLNLGASRLPAHPTPPGAQDIERSVIAGRVDSGSVLDLASRTSDSYVREMVLAALGRRKGRTLDACQIAEELELVPCVVTEALRVLEDQHRVVERVERWRATRFRIA